MKDAPRAPLLIVLGLLVACASRRDERDVSGDARAAVASATDAADEPAGPDDALVDAAGPAPPTAIDPAELVRRGRELAGKLAWTEAIAALEQAAAAGDLAALEELAFEAVLIGDAARATRAAQGVLVRTDVPVKRRATAYYHLGRAAELRGDLDAAKEAYTQASALDARSTFADRLRKLAARPAPPPPASPPCAAPVASAQLCGCLHAANAPAAPDGAPATSRACVTSHRHGGGAYALTVVGRERSPTYLVAPAGKGKVRALARLDDDAAELTVRAWTVGRGADDAPVLRIDADLGTRDPGGALRTSRARTLVCALGASPRCLAELPTLARVGTPSATRQLAVELEASAAQGLLHVTVVSGPTTPSELLGTHRLW